VISHIMAQQRVANLIKPNFFAAPMTSMLLEPSMRECRDIHTHEDPFPGSIDMAMIESIGKATAVDSLAAMKHLIFDTQKVTWDELMTALDANWKGHEALRQQCLNAPKYGNDIEWVDHIGWEIEKTIIEFSRANPRANGQCFVLKCVPVTAHVPYGKGTWATPNGRVRQSCAWRRPSALHRGHACRMLRTRSPRNE
jgi:isethionate sulfite-lyase